MEENNIVKPTRENLELAARSIRDGLLVVFPTETVYGVGADADSVDAVKKAFEIKGRPADNPLILHVSSAEWIERLAVDVPPIASYLAAKFWPGPLTLVLNKSGAVSDIVTAGLSTVALRVPGHPVARTLLELADRPIAAPSANRSGRTSPTTARQAWEEIGPDVSLVVDGGPCVVGIESTVLSLVHDPAVILRPGTVTAEDISAVLGYKPQVLTRSGTALAPGMKHRHYSPRCRIVPFENVLPKLGPNDGIICLTVGSLPPQFAVKMTSLENYVAALYSAFHDADKNGVQTLYVELPPETGVGLALRDRITRAAGHEEAVEE